MPAVLAGQMRRGSLTGTVSWQGITRAVAIIFAAQNTVQEDNLKNSIEARSYVRLAVSSRWP